MSDKAKNKVMDLIKKKQRGMKSYKDRSARRIGAKAIVIQFFEDFDQIKSESDNPVVFDGGLERIGALLDSRICAIDPGATVKVCWNQENKVEEWDKLYLEAVHIVWSDYYISKNPGSDRETYIDIGALFLEGDI